MNNFYIFINFVSTKSKNEKKIDELRNYHFRSEFQLSNTRITQYAALRVRKQPYYARRCSTLVLRLPNDVTQEAVRTPQDTLTNDCFRHTPPRPHPARGRGEQFLTLIVPTPRASVVSYNFFPLLRAKTHWLRQESRD